MSSLRNGRSSGRTFAAWAAISAVATVVALQGCQTLAGSRSFEDACHDVGKGATTSWRVGFEGQRCVIMIDPVLADSELAERELPRALSGTLSPRLLNKDEVFGALRKSLPERTPAATVEGLAVVHFLVDGKGVVQERRIARSSGHEFLNSAVLAIAPLASFSPAKWQEGSWVELTVGLRTQ